MLHKKFSELSAKEFYDIARARMEVFVVEQNCAFLDLDEIDLSCEHFWWKENGELSAYLRFYQHTNGNYVLGRLITVLACRGKGLGLEALGEFLKYYDKKFPDSTLEISAQARLQTFYEKFNFVVHGDSYLEDGIPHLRMLR